MFTNNILLYIDTIVNFIIRTLDFNFAPGLENLMTGPADDTDDSGGAGSSLLFSYLDGNRSWEKGYAQVETRD